MSTSPGLWTDNARPASWLQELDLLARLDDPVLICGERGVGKTMVARRLHERSGRTGEFVVHQASMLPHGLVAGLLAGHSRGAYTGADRDEPGLAEMAHRGTLFIDEIGESAPELQVALLHFLDGAPVRRLGSPRARALDVRWVAATNIDVTAAVAQGSFRADLRDRFGYCVIQVPPLRARRAEILPLARHFFREAGSAAGDTPVEPSAEAARSLRRHDWPGNVRQLRAACRFAFARARQRPLVDGRCLVELGDLPSDVVHGARTLPSGPRDIRRVRDVVVRRLHVGDLRRG